jgi:general stress protein 26
MIKNLQKSIGRKILDRYKHRIQKAYDPSLDHCLNTVRGMLKKSKYCYLITNSNTKWPSARMVQPIIDDDTLNIWLGTNPSLRKVKECDKNPNVTLVFGSERDHANLIIYGTATLVHDLEERKKHWIGSWIMFFPSGPKGNDFVSIKVEPLTIELMNFKKNIVAEPFGLKPVKLKNENGSWKIVEL